MSFKDWEFEICFHNTSLNACNLGRGNFLYSCLLNVLLFYHKHFKKISNKGREQTKFFVHVNSEAELGNICRSSGSQANLSILSNTSHSKEEGMEPGPWLCLVCTPACAQRVQIFLGNKVRWHKRLIPVLIRTMLWLQYLYDYLCFYEV